MFSAQIRNFPPKQVGSLMSEFWLVGFEDKSGGVVLAVPEREVQLEAKLCWQRDERNWGGDEGKFDIPAGRG